MIFLANRARAARFVSCALAAAGLLASSIGHGHANDLSGSAGGVVSGGTAAMFRLQLSTGGGRSTASDARVGFSVGSSWRAAPGANVSGYKFVPAAEAGLTLRGDLVVKLGPLQLATAVANAEAGEPEARSFCAENPPICLIGAAAVVMGVIWAIDKATDRDEHPCPWAAGCD